jgi:hypothetical protein
MGNGEAIMTGVYGIGSARGLFGGLAGPGQMGQGGA